MWKSLGDCLHFEQPTSYLVKSTEYDDSYDIPVLTAGQSLLLGYTNEKEGIYRASKQNPTIIFDDFTTSFHWIDFDFKVKSSAMKMLRPRKGVNFRFVYYAMSCINFYPGGHQRHWISMYSKLPIPIPSPSEQNRIVEILDTFTSSIENLKQQIAERRKQYEYYRDQLLDLEGKEGVESKTLGEICSRITDGSHYSPNSVEKGYFMPSVKDMVSKGFDYSACKQISEKDYNDLIKTGCKPQVNDVLIAKDGSMLKYAFPVTKDEDIVVLSSIAILTPMNEIVLSSYLASFLLSEKIKEKTIREYSSKGGVPRIILKNFKKINIFIPSLKDQSRIVSILDTFEASIANLEAQLKEREKQYEYYRNKLLTFD